VAVENALTGDFKNIGPLETVTRNYRVDAQNRNLLTADFISENMVVVFRQMLPLSFIILFKMELMK